MRLAKIILLVALLAGAAWLVPFRSRRSAQTAAPPGGEAGLTPSEKMILSEASGQRTTQATTPRAAAALPGETGSVAQKRPAVRDRFDLAQWHALLEQAGSELTAVERAELFATAGAQIARQNLAWGLQLAAEMPDFHDRYLLVRSIVETVAKDDPRSAAAWSAQITEPSLRDAAYSALGMKWAETDLAGSLDWGMSLPEGVSRSNALEGVTWSWAQKDPKAVFEWATQLKDVELREQVLLKTSKILALQNPQQALDWALQFPEGTQRDQALHYAMFQWAAKDLTAAVEWSAGVPDSPLKSNSEIAIARSWSAAEGQGATQWAAGIADPMAQATALKTTLHKWAEANPAGAAAWLVERGATTGNEEIFRSVTASLVGSDPVAAAEWLKHVTNPNWRAAGERILAQQPAEARIKPPPPTG